MSAYTSKSPIKPKNPIGTIFSAAAPVVAAAEAAVPVVIDPPVAIAVVAAAMVLVIVGTFLAMRVPQVLQLSDPGLA